MTKEEFEKWNDFYYYLWCPWCERVTMHWANIPDTHIKCMEHSWADAIDKINACRSYLQKMGVMIHSNVF